MRKKSRKSKKGNSGASEEKFNLGVKHSEKLKVRKADLVRSLPEKLAASAAQSTGAKKRKHRKRHKIANTQICGDRVGEPSSSSLEKSGNLHKASSSASNGIGGEGAEKGSGKSALSKSPSTCRGDSEHKPGSDCTSKSGKSRKRRNKKSKTAGSEMQCIEPSKMAPLTKAEEVSSNSDPELIQANWDLADDSSVDGDHSEDLDTSEEDVDEEELNLGNNEVESSAVAETSSGDNSQEEDSHEVKQDVMPLKKKFSLLDKDAILKEIKDRHDEFTSRCLYISPIPTDCTFSMLKKFIPKMESCRFFVKHKSNKLCSFAFVEFGDVETATNEKSSISGHLFAGKSMRAELCSSRLYGDYTTSDKGLTVEAVDFSRIVVSGLVPEVNQTDLKSVFSTAESIRLPMSPHNFNYGHAILTYVSEAVALDAFSQRHKFSLRGHPISVNFSTKPSKTKGPITPPTASLNERDLPVHPRKEAETVQRVGKVLIKSMTSADDEKEGSTKSLRTSDLLKMPSQSRKKAAENVEGKMSVSTGGAKGISAAETSIDDVQRTESDSLLSALIKRTKKNLQDNAIEAKSEEGGESDEGSESDDDTGDEDDGGTGDESGDESGTEDGGEVVDEELHSEPGDAAGVDLAVGDDSEGEAIDASLAEVLKMRRVCAKALKSPGARRNWKPTTGKRRCSGTMPKMLPVPPKRRK